MKQWAYGASNFDYFSYDVVFIGEVEQTQRAIADNLVFMADGIPEWLYSDDLTLFDNTDGKFAHNNQLVRSTKHKINTETTNSIVYKQIWHSNNSMCSKRL
jgi:hypothetical protein